LARGLVGNLGGPEKDFSAFGSSTVSGRHRDTNRLMTCTYEEFARQGPLSPRIDPFFRWSRGSSDFFRQPPASARL